MTLDFLYLSDGWLRNSSENRINNINILEVYHEIRENMLFVAKSSQEWVVRDPEGNFWLLPAGDDPWGQRQPFTPTPETELEPVLGHYTSLLGFPF